MKMLPRLSLIPLITFLSLPAVADGDPRSYKRDYDRNHSEPDHGRFERRHDRQHARIVKGAKSGELTRKEAKRLRKQHRDIGKLAHKFKRDGRLSRYERHTLRHELDHASRRIQQFKHNDRNRPRHYGTHRRHDKHDGHFERHRHAKRRLYEPFRVYHRRGQSDDNSGLYVLLSLLGHV